MPPRSDGRDGGFTLLELAIVVAISSIVMVSLAAVLDSQTRTERHVTAVASNQEQVRYALAEVQRDLRSAEPLVAVAAGAHARQVELKHVDFHTGTITRLRWRVNLASGELAREVLDTTTGAVKETTYRLGGIGAASGFRYYEAGGAELSGSASSSIIATCTVRVRVSIEAAPERGPKPLRVQSDVNLRNRPRTSRLCGH